MSAPVSTATGSVVVVTQVYPAPQGAAPQHGPGTQVYPAPQGAAPQHGPGTQTFEQGRPQVLGTVQIMIGLLAFLFGIVMAVNAESLGVYSGVFVWGALFYVLAGSLTVAAGKSMSRCLVNGALGVSVVAAVASCTATILYSMDAAGVLLYCSCYGNYSCGFYDDCRRYMSQSMGVSGVLAVFSVLEFIVSISVAVYACKATCSSAPQQVFIVSNHLPEGSRVTMQAPPTFQAGLTSQAPPTSQANHETMAFPKAPEEGSAGGLSGEPPAYTTVLY
ncbi:membrane-spanning 4-domains subfamily A member 4A-like [Centroberyx affinis]|uniref:membrane-spanning 4-domains subfamily A member 4A-like n=1 Tax=Centroberyx affinis TaxID=166261 RepID=UPI003A5C27AA